ncbi:hypothetical protein NDU88_005877, partial [Pleurodeles waltl]
IFTRAFAGTAGNLIALPMRISWGDSPVFLSGVFLIVISTKGNASGHFIPVAANIFAILNFKVSFICSTSPD